MYAFTRAGSWYFEYEVDHQRVRRGGFPTKRLAQLAGDADRRQRIEQGIERVWGVREPRRPAPTPTLAEYVDTVYRVHHLPRLEPSTQRTARSQLKKLLAAFGRRRLEELTPARMDEYATARLRQVSGAQVREEVSRLSRVLNHARARGVLGAHPFRGWKRPKAERRDYRIVTDQEEAALLRSAPGDFADWIALALDTGLRKGELRVLEAGGVAPNELRLRQPKVKRVKVVPLTPRAGAILARRRKNATTMPFLFGQPGGRLWSLPWIDRQWSRTIRTATLSGIRFQDLRHTFATRLAELGESPAVVGEILGHKPPYAMTMRYFHAVPEAKRRAIARLAAR